MKEEQLAAGGGTQSSESGRKDKLRTPLYRQISDEFAYEIADGSLPGGQRLPAELSLAREKGVSVGTIKRVYTDLEKRGLIHKIRGSGAYVSNKAAAGSGLKESPRDTVKKALKEMARSGLSMNQIISVVREEIHRGQDENKRLRVALVDGCPETLHCIARCLKQYTYFETELYVLKDLLSGKVVIDNRCRLALVSEKYFGELIRYSDSIRLKTEEIALREKRDTIARLTVIPEAEELCILYRTREFLELVRDTVYSLGKRNKLVWICEDQLDEREADYIKKETPIIFPADYMDYGSAYMHQVVSRAHKAGRLAIPFEMEIDKGSLLHLKRMLGRFGNMGDGYGI